jgi:HK97 gp10 family phage protein
MSADFSEVETLARRFDAAPARVDRTVRTVIADAAENVASTARSLAPSDTGATRASISVEMAADGMDASIGPTTYYARFIEYGTVHMAPQPFMGPALDAVRPRLVEMLSRVVPL